MKIITVVRKEEARNIVYMLNLKKDEEIAFKENGKILYGSIYNVDYVANQLIVWVTTSTRKKNFSIEVSTLRKKEGFLWVEYGELDPEIRLINGENVIVSKVGTNHAGTETMEEEFIDIEYDYLAFQCSHCKHWHISHKNKSE